MLPLHDAGLGQLEQSSAAMQPRRMQCEPVVVRRALRLQLQCPQQWLHLRWHLVSSLVKGQGARFGIAGRWRSHIDGEEGEQLRVRVRRRWHRNASARPERRERAPDLHGKHGGLAALALRA